MVALENATRVQQWSEQEEQCVWRVTASSQEIHDARHAPSANALLRDVISCSPNESERLRQMSDASHFSVGDESCEWRAEELARPLHDGC